MTQDSTGTVKQQSLMDQLFSLPKGGSIEVAAGSRSNMVNRANKKAKEGRIYISRKDKDSEVYRIYRLR